MLFVASTTTAVLTAACVTLKPMPGGEGVLLVRDAAEVASCKAVAGVRVRSDPHGEFDIRNQAAALGANTVLITSYTPELIEGMAYDC
jgi:hypothetical protein